MLNIHQRWSGVWWTLRTFQGRLNSSSLLSWLSCSSPRASVLHPHSPLKCKRRLSTALFTSISGHRRDDGVKVSARLIASHVFAIKIHSPIPFHVRDVSQVNMCVRNFNFDWAAREVFLQSVLIKEWIAVLDFTAAPARFLLFFLMFVQEAFHLVDYSDDDMILSIIRIKYCTFQCCSSETPQTWVTNVFPPGVPMDILILGQFSFFPLKNQCAGRANKSVNDWRSKSSFYSSQVQSGSLTQLHPLVQIWSHPAPKNQNGNSYNTNLKASQL